MTIHNHLLKGVVTQERHEVQLSQTGHATLHTRMCTKNSVAHCLSGWPAVL